MENIKAKAFNFLIKHGLGEFPIDFLRLNNMDTGFRITSYSEGKEYLEVLELLDYMSKNKGFTVSFDEDVTIFYDDDLSFAELNDTIGHEIGHIDLSHTICGKILGKSNLPKIQNKQEQEANIYSLAFHAPSLVLLEMKIYSPEVISRITGISLEAAKLAAIDIINESAIEKTGLEEKLLLTFETTIKKYSSKKVEPEILFINPHELYHSSSKPDFISLHKRNKILIGSTITICCIIILFSISIFKITKSNQNNESLQTNHSVSSITKIPIQEDKFELTTISKESILSSSNQIKLNSASAIQNEDIKDMIVYVSFSGEKYHLKECRYIKHKTNTTEINVTDVLKMGYSPCSVCDPEKD